MKTLNNGDVAFYPSVWKYVWMLLIVAVVFIPFAQNPVNPFAGKDAEVLFIEVLFFSVFGLFALWSLYGLVFGRTKPLVILNKDFIKIKNYAPVHWQDIEAAHVEYRSEGKNGGSDYLLLQVANIERYKVKFSQKTHFLSRLPKFYVRLKDLRKEDRDPFINEVSACIGGWGEHRETDYHIEINK